MLRFLIFIALLLPVVLYAIDQLISCPTMIEDDRGNIIGSEPSQYTGLWDYLKKKYNNN